MNLLVILFVFFVINGETKRKFSSLRKGREKSGFMILDGKVFFWVFEENIFGERYFWNFQFSSAKRAQRIEKDNGRVPQWKCFSFYHLIQQCFWTVLELNSETSREKIQFSVKSECEAIKRQCSPLEGSDESRFAELPPTCSLRILVKQLQRVYYII